MYYALERRTRKGRFLRYGVCGNRHLLERIRSGQKSPGEWRVICLGCAGAEGPSTTQKKAG
ncbi:hypothetical protein [Lawsonibacter sp. JLR.KK007]|jgi:hypothetical protein|uniref:hypothetical protein n=1 Tax=Lawsonibacter sp. JLR.KK007 TaxID=3114293 RepID=UPI002FF1BD65